ncbi:hypothetical protein GCWU000342_01533 [Shuttleworthella satelles DSM 14600]|uniref:Uncharacterized protein n=1 Tax=Shuttleworthella satelles DSM 14600 TaxID=626523 RepID=C4GC46_9FIRM|nr:hypothetical protein GCWU000342_01533 [Shuttleworthia satelles DSM 14600]
MMHRAPVSFTVTIYFPFISPIAPSLRTAFGALTPHLSAPGSPLTADSHLPVHFVRCMDLCESDSLRSS